jgi:hypothetical protein
MSEQGEPLHRVCGWLDDYLIVDYVGIPASAERFEDAIRRNFTALRVTSELDASAVDYGSGSSGPSAGR